MTQLSDNLFRGMNLFVDQGNYCNLQISPKPNCCSLSRTCVQTSETVSPCCQVSLLAKMSLACCPNQYYTSVQSGNIRHAYNVATHSSRGPTFDDGRIKPDLVVPGEDTLSANSGVPMSTTPNYCGIPSATLPRTETEDANMALKLDTGTSMACPLAAGAMEKIRQYFLQGRYPSGSVGGARIIPHESLLRAVILASAKPLYISWRFRWRLERLHALRG
jgi:hypothetical protein